MRLRSNFLSKKDPHQDLEKRNKVIKCRGNKIMVNLFGAKSIRILIYLGNSKANRDRINLAEYLKKGKIIILIRMYINEELNVKFLFVQ